MKKVNMVRLVISVAIGLLLISVPGFSIAANQIAAPAADPSNAVPVRPPQEIPPQPQQGPPGQGGLNNSSSKLTWPRPQASGPNNQIGFLTGPAVGDPLDIALDYVRRNRRTLGLTETDLADFVVKDRYVSPYNGVTHIYLRQRLNGIEIFNADINVNIDREGRIINLGNQFVSHLSASVNAFAPSLSAVEAVNRASQQLGLTLTAPLAPQKTLGGPTKEVVLNDGGISLEDIPVKLMYVPQQTGEVRLGWELVIRLKNGLNWWNIRVDAATGDIISQNDWIANDTYQVFALPKENPNDGPRTTVINPADPTASPFGWHDTNGVPGAEFTDTQGNNVFAQDDLDNNNSGGSRPSGGDGLVFSQTLNLSLAPSTYLSAAVTNLFYWNNILHDIHYQYGFDEASGNFQQNNYGRGGLGGDPVQADAQDGSGTNNANFATPPDAFDPRMQMYVWTFTTPNRDSDLDNGVIIHEYGHGVSTRLTGGPSNSNCLFNTEQMGEGWSDWWALALTTALTDTGSTPRGMGTYLLGQPSTGAGIRNFRYSTDMSINPQTYDNIKFATSPHDVGEVWAAMLWEMYWNLIDRYGFDPDLYHGQGGNNLAMQLVMDGLKFQPCSPSFVDGRNAILLADMVNNGGANQCPVWEAFAKRGLGFSALAGSSSSIIDGTQAFYIPLQCSNNLVLTKSGQPSPAHTGEILNYTLVAGNFTTQTLTGVSLSDNVPLNTSYIPGSASNGGTESGGVVHWNIGSLASNAVATRTFRVLVSATYPDPVALFSDTMEGGSGNWTVSHASGTENWVLNSENPHSGTMAWFGSNPSTITDKYLITANPVPIQNGTVLSFWHDYNIETGYDGGVIEISTNGGATWSDLGPAIVQNGYSGIVSLYFGNPLAGRSAFTGSSSGYQETVVDLSSYSGTNGLIRFRIATDNIVPAGGWFVDDVRITTQPPLVNSASVTSNQGKSANVTISSPVIKTASLSYTPAQIEQSVPLGQIVSNTLTLSNTGALPLSFSLADKSIPACSLLNYNHNFELGELTGWATIDGNGTWLINNGSYPRLVDGATTPPLQGNFSALVDQLGPGTNVLYQDVTLPAQLPGAVLLRWMDQWQNHALVFANNQEFRLKLYGPGGTPLLAELFSTKPGDPVQVGPTSHEVNITSLVAPYAGQSVRLQFEVETLVYYFNVQVDNVQLCDANANWASTSPVSGTIPPFSQATVAVIFNSQTVSQTGIYSAHLLFSGNMLTPVAPLPLIMHVGVSPGDTSNNLYLPFILKN